MDDCGGRRWGGRELEQEEVRGAGSRHRTCTHMHDFPLLFREVAFGEVSASGGQRLGRYRLGCSIWGGSLCISYYFVLYFSSGSNKIALTSLWTVVHAHRAFYK